MKSPFWKRRSTRIALAVALALGAAKGIWDLVLRDRFVAKKWGVVVPGLVFRSGQVSPYLIEPMLTNNSIRVVLVLRGHNPKRRDHVVQEQVVKKLGLEVCRIPMGGGGRGTVKQYVDAVSRVRRAVAEKTPILVHCHAGAQRTGAVIALYRLLVRGDQPEVAYDEMKAYGWDPRKSMKLVYYLNEKMPEVAAKLAEVGIVDGVPDPLPILIPPASDL